MGSKIFLYGDSPERGQISEAAWKKIHRCKLEKESEALHEKALVFFKGFSAIPSSIKCSLTADNPSELFREIFQVKNCKGLCLGEYHYSPSGKRVIIEHLLLLYALGVRIIGLENLQKEKLQKILDDMHEMELLDLPEEVELPLRELDEQHNLCFPNTLTNLVYEAHRIGMRIIALDTEASFIAGASHSNEKERIETFNYQAAEIISKEAKEEKFVILTGVKHGSKLNSYDFPGLSELIQCPFVIVRDREIKGEKYVQNAPQAMYLTRLCYSNESAGVHSIISQPQENESLACVIE